MTQLPFDESLVSKPLNVHVVIELDGRGLGLTIRGIFKHQGEALEFVSTNFRVKQKRRVMGMDIFDLSDGGSVEIQTWAVT